MMDSKATMPELPTSVKVHSGARGATDALRAVIDNAEKAVRRRDSIVKTVGYRITDSTWQVDHHNPSVLSTVSRVGFMRGPQQIV